MSERDWKEKAQELVSESYWYGEETGDYDGKDPDSPASKILDLMELYHQSNLLLAKRLLSQLEWTLDRIGIWYCPVCAGCRVDGHKEGCELGDFLREQV